MKKQKTYWMASMWGGLLVLGLSGCATRHEGQITLRPDAVAVYPDADRQVELDLSFRVPADPPFPDALAGSGRLDGSGV